MSRKDKCAPAHPFGHIARGAREQVVGSDAPSASGLSRPAPHLNLASIIHDLEGVAIIVASRSRKPSMCDAMLVAERSTVVVGV